MIRFDQRKRMLARRELRQWLANALMAVCVSASVSIAAGAMCWAEEGVRELKNPAEMAHVAPMRAVGIRLMPAAPIRTADVERSALPPPPPPLPALATPGPAKASIKVSVNTANLPKVAESVANATPRKPERIVPKPMLVEAVPAIPREALAASSGTSPQGGATDAVRVVPQAPIRLSFSNEEVHSNEIAASTSPAFPPATRTAGPSGSGHTEVSMVDPATARGPLLLAKSSIASSSAVSPSAAVSPAANLEVEGFQSETNVSPIPTASPEASAFLLPSRAPTRPDAIPVAQLPIPEAALPLVPPPSSSNMVFEPPADPGSFVEPAATSAPAFDLALQDAPPDIKATLAPEPQPVPKAPAMLLEASRLAPAGPALVARSYSDEELSRAIGVDLDSQGTREIQVDVAIEGVSVADERICRAIASDGRVYLVGGELGETVVEVRSSTNAEPKLLRVKVIAPWQRASHGVADLDQLRHALRPMCTDSKLSIRAQNDGSIVVQGVVDSKETAKRVLELTRKLTLVPVVDKLEIR